MLLLVGTGSVVSERLYFLRIPHEGHAINEYGNIYCVLDLYMNLTKIVVLLFIDRNMQARGSGLLG